MTARARLRVTGTVQGVGFRPFVYRHARALGLAGFVRNDPSGVLIEVEGPPEDIDRLARVLVDDPPPLASVAAVTTEAMPPSGAASGFRIERSEAAAPPTAPVGVDSATCTDCLAEVLDPTDRRYRYPFTNCTSCGPRYSIVTGVPYDRPATTMAGFAMCAACRREYDDPADRRFHAQPNACPACGPHVTWRAPSGDALAERADALAAIAGALCAGAVVAVKGIGGYHLVVDAADRDAVAELRRRKERDDKPFAIMVPDVAAAERLAVVDRGAARALTSIARPVVLCPRRADADVAPGVAPGLPDLGLMLAYSPLHHLLLADAGRPLVVTSGNLSDEPIAHDDADAVARLGPLVDGLLTHDRPIHIRCDDSVVRAGARRVQALRRSRGMAPRPLELPGGARRTVLAVGAELKSTVAVVHDGVVVASHHLGDLEHLATYRSFRQAIDHLIGLYDLTPDVVAHDLHPEYLSTKFAQELDLPLVAVQHHHAHVAACMVDHGRTRPVLGLAFDGLGYGTDGALWGGEALVAGFDGSERVGHLRPVVMPGGVAAIREPWRMAVAWAEAAGVAVRLDEPDQGAVAGLVEAGRGPVTTSVGRLLDGLAAWVTGRHRVRHEAQAVIELEALARGAARPGWSGLVTVEHDGAQRVLDPTALVVCVARARSAGTDPATIAAGIHEAVADGATRLAVELSAAYGLDTVALTGGVFQNVLLSDLVETALTAHGLEVLVHERVPPNDGGISIGQAAIAASEQAEIGAPASA